MSETQEASVPATRTLRDRMPRFAPLAAGLVVVLLLVAVALVVRDGRAGPASVGQPPALQLSTTSGAVAADTAATKSGDHYVLAGRLPAGQPDSAPVYRFGTDRAPADLARRLATALGLPGNPTRTPTGWQLVSGRQVLTLRDGEGWAWSLRPNVIVADSPVQCFRAPCPYETTESDLKGRVGPAPLPPSVAERIAKDMLTKLGLPTTGLTTSSGGPLVQVRVPRSVDGKDTDGFSTTLSISGAGSIYGAGGWLGEPAGRGPAYPLVSAATAFKRLQAQPYPEILLCRPQTGGGCAPTPKAQVTGAELGLMMATDSSRPLLVPAWLFRVAAQADPIAVLAVESRYLRTPAEPEPNESISSGTGGGGSMPQSIPPADPKAVPASPKPR